MKTKIFITGSTGELGKRVLERFAKHKNVEVTALSRSLVGDEIIASFGANPVRGTLFDVEKLEVLTKGQDIILHLATNIPKVKIPRKRSYWKQNDRIRIEGTKNLLEVAKRNGIKRMISQSVLYVLGDMKSKYIDSGSYYDSRPAKMVESAIELEKMMMNQSDTRAQVIRFARFYSAQNEQTKELIETFKNGKMPMVGKGDFFWNFIHLDDAASFVEYCTMKYKKETNEILNISDFHALRFSNFFFRMNQLTGAKKANKVPRWLVRILFGRSMYKIFTDSLRVRKRNDIAWTPFYKDFFEGIQPLL